MSILKNNRSHENHDDGWKTRYLVLASNQENEENINLIPIFEAFNKVQWKGFIRDLIRRSQDIEEYINILNDEEPIVYFSDIFSYLNSSSQKLIGIEIKLLLQSLLKLKKPDKQDLENAKNALFIAYATPIYTDSLYLLKQIAMKKSLSLKLRSYAACIIAGQYDELDIDWWKKLVRTDDIHQIVFAQFAIESISKHSIPHVMKFINDLLPPDFEKTDQFKIVFRELLDRILEYPNRAKDGIFLRNFPAWSREIIINLLQLKKLQPLQNEWLQDYVEFLDCCFLKEIEDKSIQIKSNLPKHKYDAYKSHEKVVKEIERAISNNCEIVVVFGQDGNGKTTTVVEAANRFLNKSFEQKKIGRVNDYGAIIFSKKKELNEIFDDIGKVLDDELIKRAAPVLKSEVVAKSLKQNKSLLIIDDFNISSEEERGNIFSFISQIRERCQIIITTKYDKELDGINKKNSYEEFYLSKLSENETEIYASKRAKEREINITDPREIINYKKYKGVPLAINLALAKQKECERIELKNHKKTVLKSLSYSIGNNSDENPVYLFYEQSVKCLDELNLGKSSKVLLSLAAQFNGSLTKSAFEKIASRKLGQSKSEIDNILNKLESLELINSVSQDEKIEDNSSFFELQDSIRGYLLKDPAFLNDPNTSKTSYVLGKDEAYNLITDYYLRFTEVNGGDDWEDWTNYKNLQREWTNILSILKWNAENNRIDNVKTIWFSVNRFADLYGYWSDRQQWLDFLIERYQNSGDQDTHVRCLSSKGWTKIMLGNLSISQENFHYLEAQQLLEKAWNLRDADSVSQITKSYLAHNMTVLYYRQNNIKLAKIMLQEQKSIYHELYLKFHNKQEKSFTERDLKRYEINFQRNEAKIKFKEGFLTEAYTIYLDCLHKSSSIKWTRMESYCNYMLVETILTQEEENKSVSELKQKRLSDACTYFHEGVQIAFNNKNKRRLAFFKMILSRLYKQLENSPKSFYWEEEAKKDFHSLGIN